MEVLNLRIPQVTDWQSRLGQALDLIPLEVDSAPVLAEPLEVIGECGRHLRVRPLQHPLLANPARAVTEPMRVSDVLVSLLAQGEPQAFSMVTALQMSPRKGEEEWFLPMALARNDGWRGNLKKLKLRDGRLLDARGNVVDLVDKLLPPHALTLWTDPGDSALQSGGALAGDGAWVDLGGAGGRITLPRQVFTEHPQLEGEWLPLADEAASGLLRPFLDPQEGMSSSQVQDLLSWVRGQDSFDEDGDGDTGDARPWLMGDVLHSAPVAVNYGHRRGSGYSVLNPDVRLLFGSNDGYLRMLRNTRPDGAEDGSESFAFMPLELMSRQARLAGVLPTGGSGHVYGLDGEIAVLRRDSGGDGAIDSADGDLAWLYFGQRRGGSHYYALDVSNPEAPRLGWKVGPHSPACLSWP